MKKILFLAICLSFVTIQLHAQIKFNINLLPDHETYLVSLTTDETIDNPLNMSSNIQVVIKAPFEVNSPFVPVNIESQIQGVDWVDNAFMDDSGSAPSDDYTLIAFTMVQSSTKSIVYENGTETPIFTFKNLNNVCVGEILLPENDDVVVQKAITEGFNFTQSISVLKTRGNAFHGIENASVNCEDFDTGITPDLVLADLKTYPVPADDILNIEWTNLESYERLAFEIFSAKGDLVQTLEVENTSGKKTAQLDISKYAQGLYSFRSKSEKGFGKIYKFIVIK